MREAHSSDEFRVGPAPASRAFSRVPASNWLARVSSLVLFTGLALGLVLPKVAGAVFLLLALLAIIWLEPWLLRNRWNLARHEKLLILAVFAFVATWMLAWMVHGLDSTGHDDVGRILRLLLIIPVYLFLRRVEQIEWSWWWGLAAGGAIAGGYAIGFAVVGEAGQWAERVGGPTNPIYFGGIVLAFALMLLPRIADAELHRSARLAIAASVLLALGASALSGSRGAWLALPLLLLLYQFTLGTRQTPAWRIGLPLAILTFVVAISLLPGVPLGQRIGDGLSSMTRSEQAARPDDTLAIRWQMWRISGQQIRQDWLFGGGPGNFRAALEQAVADGRLAPRFLEYHHPHNQYLSVLLIAGLPGLFSLLLLFGVVLRRFTSLWQTGLERTRMLGWSGLAAITVLSVMSVSESIFQRNSGIVWFGLLIAGASAMVTSRRRRELFAQAPRRQHSISVIMICRDEAERIARALDSVAGWADEIIVLDSGSTDATVEICRRFTGHVDITDWPGFGAQKQRAMDRATGDWILSLDADEVVSEELRREIDQVLGRAQPHFDGYRLPWTTRAFGSKLQFGHWARAPLRLVRRGAAAFTDAPVHEKLVMRGPNTKTGKLEGVLYHDTFRNIEHARKKLSTYADLQAAERAATGRRASMPGAVIRALLNFADNFLLRGAFLDGRAGWIMSRLYAGYTYRKYRQLARLSSAGV
ncbi:MAG: glycosyltransferase [Wenzhouxiangellaceae bacterium]|nr:glycosyltransferase [Wenzhouxiangellaceae bacterium]